MYASISRQTQPHTYTNRLEGVSRASLLSEANDDSADRSFQIRRDTSQRQADSHSEYHPQRRPKLLPTPRHMTGPPELASPPSSSLKSKSEDSAHPTITINTHTNRVDTPEELGVHVWSHPSSQVGTSTELDTFFLSNPKECCCTCLRVCTLQCHLQPLQRRWCCASISRLIPAIAGCGGQSRSRP